MESLTFIKNNLINENGYLNAELLKKERWLYYLAITKNIAVNRERVQNISGITGKETLEYVFRTLEILDELYANKDCDEEEYLIIQKVLCWSEVAKGGTEGQRKIWEEKGYPLDIHNLASAKIYLDETKDEPKIARLVAILIETHGVVGQSIRGEVCIKENAPLSELKSLLSEDSFLRILRVLNECIIRAVGTQIWCSIDKTTLEDIYGQIIAGEFREYDTIDRMKKLSNIFVVNEPGEFVRLSKVFEEKVFPKYELWYFNSALCEFSVEEINDIFEIILNSKDIDKAEHINFKPLADNLYYDYESKKKINVYKKRIIEHCLKTKDYTNASPKVVVNNNAISFDFGFSLVCNKLIDFCVEAERSGLLSFEKSINVLFDMFGFKRDEFDRLNNEDKYLNTMNDAADSKKSIVYKVVGEKIVDVGSGGGIMLDLLESVYPEKIIIGTDISTNVLEALEEKKKNEGHNWNTLKHNFVDGPLIEKVDTIIFSSILHEIYSYTDTPEGKFNIKSVEKALMNAFNSLNEGGRIVIRDGVKTEGKGLLTINFKTKEGMDFFNNYYHDFKGLKDVSRNIEFLNDRCVRGDVNFMREFMYTYTWGTESYAHEINEQFGYYTLEEFVNFFKGIGATVIEANQFLEQGYVDNLSKLIDIEPCTYPDSNCIVVIQR